MIRFLGNPIKEKILLVARFIVLYYTTKDMYYYLITYTLIFIAQYFEHIY